MAANINITACDNELIIIAFTPSISYQIGRILSGNNQGVSVTLNLVEDTYVGGPTLNGTNNPLNDVIDVCLPAGTYSLFLCGINWGGPTAFAGTVTDSNGIQTPINNNLGINVNQLIAPFQV